MTMMKSLEKNSLNPVSVTGALRSKRKKRGCLTWSQSSPWPLGWRPQNSLNIGVASFAYRPRL